MTIPVRVPSRFTKATDVNLEMWLTSIRELPANVYCISHQSNESKRFLMRIFSNFSPKQLERIQWRQNVDFCQCFVRQSMNSVANTPYFTSNPRDGTTVFFPAVYLHTSTQIPSLYNVELHFKTHKMVVHRMEGTKIVQEECTMRLFSVGGPLQ